MSRADLVDVYISGLNLAEVVVVSNGRQCRITNVGEFVPGEKIKASYHLKPTHADLVLATIGREGLSGKPAALVAAIERTAEMLGAPYQRPDELRRGAEQQVDEITARIKGLEPKRRAEADQQTIPGVSPGEGRQGRAGAAVQQNSSSPSS